MPDFDRRLLRGGLPESLLAARKDPAFLSEWIREDDRGVLWEHLVLDALRARHPDELLKSNSAGTPSNPSCCGGRGFSPLIPWQRG